MSFEEYMKSQGFKRILGRTGEFEYIRMETFPSGDICYKLSNEMLLGYYLKYKDEKSFNVLWKECSKNIL